MKAVQIKDFFVGGKNPLVLIAGPCVIEDAGRTLAIGRAVKEIADRLGISAATVSLHLHHIYAKLHVRSRTEAVVKYMRRPH